MQLHVTREQRFQWLPLVSQVGDPCIINFLSRRSIESLLSCVARAFRPSAAIFPRGVFRYHRSRARVPSRLSSSRFPAGEGLENEHKTKIHF